MSRAVALVLLHDRIVVYDGRPSGGSETTAPLCELPWRGDIDGVVLAALAGLPIRPSTLVVIVGLAWLDVARPDLPPVSADSRRRMLQLDPERHFAIEGAAAVAVCDDAACALSSTRLATWVDALRGWASVEAVMALPQAVRLAGVQGTWHTEAAPQETAIISVHEDHVRDVRRTRQTTARESRLLDLAVCARAALVARPIPTAWQLLDAAAERRLAGAAQAAWWRAAVLLCAAVLVALWSANHRRDRELAALRATVIDLERQAGPATLALARLQRAADEQQILNRGGSSTHDAIVVLAALGTLLPADVVVQRVEWDGQLWRVDGSATDAAGLVPRLDASPQFTDVRSLAPTTRFLDGGRARSSFSLGFRTEVVRAEGAP